MGELQVKSDSRVAASPQLDSLPAPEKGSTPQEPGQQQNSSKRPQRWYRSIHISLATIQILRVTLLLAVALLIVLLWLEGPALFRTSENYVHWASSTLVGGILLLFVSLIAAQLWRAKQVIGRLKAQKSCLLELAKSKNILTGNVFNAAKEICFQGTNVLRATRCSVWTFSDDYEEARCLVLYDAQSRSFSSDIVLSRSQCPASFEKLLHQKICSFSLSSEHKDFFEELSKTSGVDVTRVVSANVTFEGRLEAVICVISNGWGRAWEPDEENFSASLADLFAISLSEQRRKALESDSQLKSLAIDSALDSIGVLNAEGRFILANRALLKNFGYSEEVELLFRSWKILFPDAEIRRFDEYLNARFRRDGKLLVETIGLRRDGSTFPQEVSLSYLDSERWVVVSRDISRRKKVERNAEQIALFATLDPSPVIRFDSKGKILIANPASIELLHLSYNDSEYVQDSLPELADFDFSELIRAGGIRAVNVKIGRSSHRVVLKGIPYLECGHLYTSDVSDLKEREAELESQRTLLQDVLNANPNLILLKDREGRIRMINEAAAALFGRPVEELIGCFDTEFLADEAAIARMRAEDSEVLSRKKQVLLLEDTYVDSNKEVRWLQTMKKPILVNGELHVLGVATDITEQKTLREQIVQSSKIEALGQMAGGIAHDFNNLLTAVFGYTNLLKALRSSDSEVVEAADMIEKASRRASELTEKLLGFARKGKQRNVPINLHEILDEIYSLIKRTFESSIQIEISFCPSSVVVTGDPTQMHQVFLNLALNARDAMSTERDGNDGGRLSISTHVVSREELRSEVQRGTRAQLFVRVDVSDSGCGMSDETRHRIFEPFFTTKDAGKGTGMGLAMVYGIIQNHSGYIHVESEVDRGSVFSVYLPLSSAEESTCVDESERDVRIQYGEGRVLLVEDHPLVRKVAERMLTSLGYEVTTLADGRAALDLFAKDPSAFDLVILDLIMPSMSAAECYRQMSLLNPRVKVLLSTGYVVGLEIEELLLRGVQGFVQKPYRLPDFSQAVARAIGQNIDRSKLRSPIPSKAIN